MTCTRDCEWGVYHAPGCDSKPVGRRVRFALVRGAGPIGSNLRRVEAYLYSNYSAFQSSAGTIIIAGTDSAGFTLEALRHRFASGLIVIDEINP